MYRLSHNVIPIVLVHIYGSVNDALSIETVTSVDCMINGCGVVG